MSANRKMDPRTGTMGQSQTCNEGKGGVNMRGRPFGQAAGTNNHSGHASPQFGSSGQRLAGGGKVGKPSAYPPGFTSR